MGEKRVVLDADPVDFWPKVVVRVSGGCCDAVKKPKGIILEIVDYDVEGSGVDHITQTYNAEITVDAEDERNAE